jgi:MFS family permease
VGSEGKYQKRLLLVLGLSWFVTGIILLSTGFLFRSPSFDCQEHGLLVTDLHCEQYVCSLDEALWQDYLSSDNHFHSLATSGNYLCSNSVAISLVSSCTYLGALVGYVAVSFLADNFGRRKALLGAWSVCAVGTVVVASSLRLEVAAVGFFLSGFGSDAAVNLTLLFFA